MRLLHLPISPHSLVTIHHIVVWVLPYYQQKSPISKVEIDKQRLIMMLMLLPMFVSFTMAHIAQFTQFRDVSEPYILLAKYH